MKLFACPNCRARIFFENSMCLACGTAILYDPQADMFVEARRPGHFSCGNAAAAGCNWRAPVEGGFCRACELNRTIPNLSDEDHRQRWREIETAKRRLVRSLLSFGLEVRPKGFVGEEAGIAFEFLADQPGAGPADDHIVTGHDSGLITLNIAEADPAEREKMRMAMGEPYRTLLGHFRHEIGHYYWDRLIRDDPQRLGGFRDAFGDERAEDYGEALQRHYAHPPAADWPQHFISAYAASHPWEDWAETWAHYLHIVDTLEMAADLGLLPGEHPSPKPAEGGRLPGRLNMDFDRMLERWLALSVAVNSINRCMGLADVYPFVISEGVAAKLGFVDALLRG